MPTGRTLTIGLLLAIVLVRFAFNGHLIASWEALWGPVAPLGGA